MLKAGYIRHTVHKLTFSEQCYYVFGDIYSQGTKAFVFSHLTSTRFLLGGMSQLTLDEEPEDYESVSDQTSTSDRRSADSLLTARANPLTTFGFVDKNQFPLPSPSHSASITTSSGETRALVDVPNQLRSSKESFQRAMTNPLPREFFVDVM